MTGPVLGRLTGAILTLALALTVSACSTLTSWRDDVDGSSAVTSAAPTGSVVGTPPPLAASLNEALGALTGTEHFTTSGVEHVLSGEINRRGAAVGYHSTALGDLAAGEVVPGTASALDSLGLYEAQVVVDGTAKSGNSGYSTFYPESWTAQEVIDAINEAYASRVTSFDDGYDGVTSGGITIHMYLDDADRIRTAYPVMED